MDNEKIADRITRSIISADSVEKIANVIRGGVYDLDAILKELRGRGHMLSYSDNIGNLADYIKMNSKAIAAVDNSVPGLGAALFTLSKSAKNIAESEKSFTKALNEVTNKLEDSRFLTEDDL